MRGLTRRSLLSLAAIGGFAGWALSSGLRDHVLRMIGESFGPEVGRSEVARAFAADILVRLDQEHPEQLIVERVFYRLRPMAFPRILPQETKLADHLATEFVLATNVLQVLERQESRLEYFGLHDPERSPCRNTLGAGWSA
ncbi:MAG: hypothetical protein N2Z62_04335 [Rhodobacteraceae bacterium]|nr:hypothetical protein [Paracoccaceae bacterium]